MASKGPVDNSRSARKAGRSPKISDARKRWVRTEDYEFIHYHIPEAKRDSGEGSLEGWGDSHALTIVPRGGGGPNMTIGFSEMTAAELEATRKIINTVLDEAQQVCEHRDNMAQEAYDNGEDGFYRLYRSVPDVVERKGKV